MYVFGAAAVHPNRLDENKIYTMYDWIYRLSKGSAANNMPDAE